MARGETSDLGPVADLCATPTILVTDDRCVGLADRADLLRFWGELVEEQRRMEWARTDIHHLEIRALNARSALIEGTFSRHDGQGREYARLGSAYLVIKTEIGWQFAVLMITPPS